MHALITIKMIGYWEILLIQKIDANIFSEKVFFSHFLICEKYLEDAIP
jgi:hypothetical protein